MYATAMGQNLDNSPPASSPYQKLVFDPYRMLLSLLPKSPSYTSRHLDIDMSDGHIAVVYSAYSNGCDTRAWNELSLTV